MVGSRESFHPAGTSRQDTGSPCHCGLSTCKSPGSLFPDNICSPGEELLSTDRSDDGSSPPAPTLSSHTANNFFRLYDNKSDTHAPSGSTHLHRLTIPSPRSNVNTDLDCKAPLPSAATSATNAGIFGGENMPKEGQDKSNNRTKNKNEDSEAGQDELINFAPFHFKPFQLAQILALKDLPGLTALGGTDGIIRGLGTHPERGLTTASLHTGENPPKGTDEDISHDLDSEKQRESGVGIIFRGSSSDRDNNAPYTGTIDDRKRVYGENIIPTISKTLPQFMAAALQDKILILLSITAVVSLALGLFKALGTPKKSNEPLVNWVEGVAIVVAIAVVVVVGSVNNWQTERQFKALNERKGERVVKVIRDGVEKVIDIKEVVVGDIGLVEPGEIIPCDGIFISGHDVQCNELRVTGESDTVQKLSYTDVVGLKSSGPSGSLNKDCFVISGSKVIGGVGKYVVVAVGKRSSNGLALRTDTEGTPLQAKLNILAAIIANVGSLTGLVLFVGLMAKFFVELGTQSSSRTPCDWGVQFLKNLIISITLVVIAVPKGLSLPLALALSFATKRMTYDNLLVRVLGSCETMAHASVICTDKTGTLTQNVKTVVAGSVGIHAKFVRSLDRNSSRTNAETQTSASGSEVEHRHSDDFSIDQAQLNNVLPDELQYLFNEAIAVNSTAFEDTINGQNIFVGSKTEAALLQFAKELNWRGARETREAATVVHVIPFVSDLKIMAVVIKKSGGYRAYFTGASEILARNSTKHIVVREDGNYTRGIEIKDIDDLSQENISRTIIFYANQMLGTIALAYRDLDSWPPEGRSLDEPNEVTLGDLAKDLTLIAITALEDPLRQGIRETVLNCQRAGVSVKMCTGDNALTARAIAMHCGISTPGGIIMEGPAFRCLSEADMSEVLPRLQVLARASSEDKKILVERLRQTGNVVGVTGDGSNDGPALKMANVGFSMGIAGTEVAKEASDIILMDDSFTSILKAIMWGRCVHDGVRKFLQFQFSTMISAVVITLASSLVDSPAFSVVQLLWISIIMDAFAALALTTDPASEVLLSRTPYRERVPLLTVEMYKMILLQSVYQITIILVFYFNGSQILGLGNNTDNSAVVKTLVFNMFVFTQIFNSVNCRRLDSQLNIFEGIFKNRYFIAIILIEIVIQVIVVFFGGAVFQVTRIEGREWGISLGLGFFSIPWGSIVRLLPTIPFEWLFKVVHLIREEALLPIIGPSGEAWGAVLGNIRGGGPRTSAFLNRGPPQDDQLRISSILTTAPTIMIGAVIGDPRYFQPGSRSDPANTHPSRSSTALWHGRPQMHPDTDRDDSVYRRFASEEHIS